MASPNFKDMTPEERAELGRRGGVKSGEAKRRKKQMKETLEVLLSMPMKKGRMADVEDIRSFADIRGKNISVEAAMMVQMLQKALKGDTNAAAFIRDTSGQRPQEDVNLTGSVPVVITGDRELED